MSSKNKLYQDFQLIGNFDVVYFYLTLNFDSIYQNGKF